ncbi:DNA-binding transcriptional LysR family regulator [Natronospira proteinivora]|uniref:DNA-binding transcriptional LysR family regulator n=1 Tax=Natronospira proteinivora TaxID=1807133 RepID=A0ABT1G8M0_9GAMM|nr:LysR family transcriptional regulator [Natronospira proteinivora]MCP1727576.1 DNA-binding transcriptional LysR family regulator [Natronospira proteinivora]
MGMKKMVSDTQLQALVAVADEGSFTRAASVLALSQSAISHAVTALEDSLGVRLLERDNQGVRLTKLGESIVSNARESLRQKTLIFQQAKSARDLRQGLVRVGSFGPTSSRHLLPPVLDLFTHRHPELEIQIMEGSDQEVDQWLHDNHIDAGFVTLPTNHANYVHIARDELLVILPADSELAQQEKVHTNRLSEHAFIMSTGGCEPEIEALVAKGCLDVQYRIREVQTIIEMVARGSGISIKPALSLPDPLPEGVIVRPLTPRCEREVGLAQTASGGESPAINAFFRTVSAVAKTRAKAWGRAG